MIFNFIRNLLIKPNEQLYIIYSDYEDNPIDIKIVDKDTHYYTYHYYNNRLKSDDEIYVYKIDLLMHKHNLDVNIIVVNEHESIEESWVYYLREDVMEWLYEIEYVEHITPLLDFNQQSSSIIVYKYPYSRHPRKTLLRISNERKL